MPDIQKSSPEGIQYPESCTRINWLSSGFGMAVFSALMLSACIKPGEKKESESPQQEQLVGELECSNWELREEIEKLGEKIGELKNINKEQGEEAVLLHMRIDGLLKAGKGTQNNGNTGLQPGASIPQDVHILGGAVDSEIGNSNFDFNIRDIDTDEPGTEKRNTSTVEL